ncbi:hypothetical protein HK096_006036 [Nowakowskiella sp. JEL0078]|nr:hypothetical protein HK096_006036 [Nowakowskiella sp. JEL0078]
MEKEQNSKVVDVRVSWSLASNRNMSVPSLSEIIGEDVFSHPNMFISKSHGCYHPSTPFYQPESSLENISGSCTHQFNAVQRNQSISSKHSLSSIESSGFYSLESIENIELNEDIARNWQPEKYHMMRADARMDTKRRFHAIESSPYMLPADIEEQDRLYIQHVIIKHIFGRQHFFTSLKKYLKISLFRNYHMPFRDILSKPGSRVLDCGCGPGNWTRDVAQMYPHAKIHALVGFSEFIYV